MNWSAWCGSVEKMLDDGSFMLAARAIVDMTHMECLNDHTGEFTTMWTDLAFAVASPRAADSQHTLVLWFHSLADASVNIVLEDD